MEEGFMIMPMVVSLGFFAMIVWIVWPGTNAKNRRAQAQVEVQTKLIERFGSAKEFIDFLQSPAGRQFVTGVEVTSTLYARDRVITWAQPSLDGVSAPRIDAFATMLSLPGAVASLVDVNDKTDDGNQRVDERDAQSPDARNRAGRLLQRSTAWRQQDQVARADWTSQD